MLSCHLRQSLPNSMISVRAASLSESHRFPSMEPPPQTNKEQTATSSGKRPCIECSFSRRSKCAAEPGTQPCYCSPRSCKRTLRDPTKELISKSPNVNELKKGSARKGKNPRAFGCGHTSAGVMKPPELHARSVELGAWPIGNVVVDLAAVALGV